jgi:hypothetical protein
MARSLLRNARPTDASRGDCSREVDGPFARTLKGLLRWTASCCGAFGFVAATDSMMGLQDQLDVARVADRADNVVELRRMRSQSQLRRSRSLKRPIKDMDDAEVSGSRYTGAQRYPSTVNDGVSSRPTFASDISATERKSLDAESRVPKTRSSNSQLHITHSIFGGVGGGDGKWQQLSDTQDSRMGSSMAADIVMVTELASSS